MNGEEGCNRYVISQCSSALNVLEVMGLFLLGGWTRKLSVDIVPLFETVEDLQAAAAVMEELYEPIGLPQAFASSGANTQTIMLGFSDGTKDGGYLMANWAIYKAKEELTEISKKIWHYRCRISLTGGAGRLRGEAERRIASMLPWGRILPTSRYS
jgi:phosphoenolpyruvate carboxylase